MTEIPNAMQHNSVSDQITMLGIANKGNKIEYYSSQYFQHNGAYRVPLQRKAYINKGNGA